MPTKIAANINPSFLWAELGKLIDLPKDCRKFTLTCNVGEAPTVVAECFVRGSVKRDPVTRRYRLEEIVEDPSLNSQPSTLNQH